MITEDFSTGKFTEAEKQTLSDFGFLVESSEIERKEMLNFIDALGELSRTFAAKVAMNLDCNLSCKYCFEGARKGKYYMTSETADLFLGFLNNRVASDKEKVLITFYGGEPLLSLDLIIYMSERIKGLAGSKCFPYEGHIITNGTLLTRKNAKRLASCGVTGAYVTIDGPRDVHNSYRPFESGKGSFDIIVKNLKESCDVLELQIGGNFTSDNFREFPLLLDYIRANGLPPERISGVRFEPVTKERADIAPPEFHGGCGSLNEEWLFNAGLYLREEILKRGYKNYTIVPTACSLDMKEHFLVNYDGGIFKCPGLIGREEYKVGHLKTGMKYNRQPQGLDSWKNEECLNCAYLPLCFGGCRYMKLVRDGNMDGVDCKKPYLDACLETLVKQDIRYGLV